MNMDKNKNHFDVRNNDKMRMFVDGNDGLDGNYQYIILTTNNLVRLFGFLNVSSLTPNNTPIKRIFRIVETYDYNVFDFSKLDDTYTEIDLHYIPNKWGSMMGYFYTKNCFAEDVQPLINPRISHEQVHNDKYNFSCDKNIYNLMDTLNKIGCGTRFSCEGNVYSIKDGLFSEGYVKFNDDVYVKELIENLVSNGIKYSSKDKSILIDNILPHDKSVSSISNNLMEQLLFVDDGSYIGDFKKLSFLNNDLFISGRKKLQECKLLSHSVITLPYSVLQLQTNDHTMRFGLGCNLDDLANIIVR